VVGAPGASTEEALALRSIGASWQVDGRLRPDSIDAGASRRFGHAIAFEDPIVFIGAPNDDTEGANSVRSDLLPWSYRSHIFQFYIDNLESRSIIDVASASVNVLILDIKLCCTCQHISQGSVFVFLRTQTGGLLA